MASRQNNTKQQYLREISERNKILHDTANNITFNFKFFQSGDYSGQSFEEWEREQILADLNNKLKDYSGKSRLELQEDGTLEIYTQYPNGSKFREPAILKAIAIDIEWARLRVTGRRRLIGFFHKHKKYDIERTKNEVFYVVFLDKNHEFAPSRKNR